MTGDIWENNISAEGIDLIKKLLVVNPDHRLSGDDVL
jgi:hypothetical protein